VAANVFLILMVIGSFMMVALGQSSGGIQEEVIQAGSSSDKIVVIDLRGMIDSQQAQHLTDQLRAVRRDQNVRGLILRINSPGGGITASDDIYHQLRTLREEESIPIVAFMQSMATSGGYYAAVACDKIMAEPTTITGSIGVIMANMVMQELLEEKLGIHPVIVKSGLKKDWPSSFKMPSEEQLQYLQDKLIQPAYQRFVDVVAEGREDILTREEIKLLADGSIYSAPEAAEEHLIDELGYLRDAIDLAESLAGVVDARVVEYREIFTLATFLQARSQAGISLDPKTLLHWTTPEVMYLWRPY
jgi:protease-4